MLIIFCLLSLSLLQGEEKPCSTSLKKMTRILATSHLLLLIGIFHSRRSRTPVQEFQLPLTLAGGPEVYYSHCIESLLRSLTGQEGHNHFLQVPIKSSTMKTDIVFIPCLYERDPDVSLSLIIFPNSSLTMEAREMLYKTSRGGFSKNVHNTVAFKAGNNNH